MLPEIPKKTFRKGNAMERNENQKMTENQGKKEFVTRLGMDEMRRVWGGGGTTVDIFKQVDNTQSILIGMLLPAVQAAREAAR